MKNFKMVLAYDGSRYKGWQRLGSTENTIQGKLEAVLQRLTGESVEVIGSGRTDAGVHALGQVANFHTDSPLTAEELLAALRTYLPEDIGVFSLVETDGRFHSRLSALRKTYRYRIWNADAPCVFERKYFWKIREPLNLAEMRKAAEHFLGEHDFLAFCSNKHFKKSSLRTVERIAITEENGAVTLDFTGNGFLYNMVRILTGTLVEVGLGQRSADSIPEILKSRKRENAGAMAPAQGLFLMEVEYP